MFWKEFDLFSYIYVLSLCVLVSWVVTEIFCSLNLSQFFLNIVAIYRENTAYIYTHSTKNKQSSPLCPDRPTESTRMQHSFALSGTKKSHNVNVIFTRNIMMFSEIISSAILRKMNLMTQWNIIS